MKLTAQEEYGLRCLLQVARRSPEPSGTPVPIRDVAEGEGLSMDYAAKLLRIMRQGGLLTAARGASGGFRLAVPAHELRLSTVMKVLDSPLYGGAEFCDAHAGQRGACVHNRGCTLRILWIALEGAVGEVLERLVLADLLDHDTVQVRVSDSGARPPVERTKEEA